ncbi:hypothetical protein GHT06_008993 [Daphnia sinensis]|uniref:Uncharacterized protein n=1 Tax=Daphnia sinensis TaxID=1820382 RepID=A0AAD5LM35_9CRUS|nr:hypothetical protein GHT06_008993 [Daphnia sinensis]
MTRLVSPEKKLRSCLLLLLVFLQPTRSAIVAHEKVSEIVQQAQRLLNTTLADGNLRSFELEGNNGAVMTQLVQPLSLQIAVMQVTAALSREMNLPKWQAMLRALGGDREVLKRFAQMRSHFALLEKRLSAGQDGGIEEQLNQIAALSTSSTTWARVWQQLQTLIQEVDNLHDWFDRYQRNSAVVNERTLRDFAETVHSGFTIERALASIHEAVCPYTMDDEDIARPDNSSVICNGGVLETLQTALTRANDSFICSLSKSSHQLVYDLYALLTLTDAKGYAMMQFSWMLLRLYGKGSYATETEKARIDFERRMTEKAEAAQNVLSNLTNWMWKCDTPKSEQIENETYIQFTELLQGYVVNEVDLNQDNTCKESCSAYSNSQEKGCFGNQLCAQSRRCSSGRIYNCGFIEADSNVCVTNKPGRRYDWIQYKSGRVFGQKSECNSSTSKNVKTDSWWRWVFWHCSYCMCLCDQPGTHSDRYVSLQSALAASASNRLVTGVRFVKKDRVLHIQIQEGEALPQGSVNETTLQWQPITPITIPSSQQETAADGLGYATLRYEERALDLDDLVAPKGHVITGLRFRKLGGHLNLEAQASPIDFMTGSIDSERAIWLSNDNTPATETNPRTKVSLLSPDVSTRSHIPSVPDSASDQFIEFQVTSLEKDVSQTTVPFIEATPVAPEPPVWLTGIGIYHKGQPGYGGYVAFRIATLNFSDYMTVSSEEFNYTLEEDTLG